MLYYVELETIVGQVYIIADEDAIVEIQFAQENKSLGDAQQQETPLLHEAKRQLEEYFAGQRASFSLPLNPQGTEFQKKVWQQLEAIPYGETRSYGQIAAAVGNPKACRAVGGANHNNPIAIVIPCHRVIGANGKLTGYGGGLDIKEKLLKLEGILE